MDLKEASQRLGVHYQTAYRWVREGALPAGKLGTSYEIDEEALTAFMARRSTPVPPPKATRVRDWDAQVGRFHDLLVAGDELACRALVDRLHRGNADCMVLCERLVTPALRQIGEDWAVGRITVAHEHRAAGICDRLLTRAAPHPRGRPRGTAIVCTPPGEEHGLPAAMAAMALRADRWKVHLLGTEVPADDLLAFVRDTKPDLAVLSVTLPHIAPNAKALAARLGVPTLVGAPGRSLSELRQLARQRKALPDDDEDGTEGPGAVAETA